MSFTEPSSDLKRPVYFLKSSEYCRYFQFEVHIRLANEAMTDSGRELSCRRLTFQVVSVVVLTGADRAVLPVVAFADQDRRLLQLGSFSRSMG